MKKAVSCFLAAAIAAVNFMSVIPASAASFASYAAPDEISGLKVWYDAEDLSLENGAKVSKWENKAGDHDFDAVQTDASKQPQFVLQSEVSKKPGVVLNDNTYLQLENQFDLNDMSVFAVVRFDSLNGNTDDNQIFSKLMASEPWAHNWYFNVSNQKFNFGWKDGETWRDYQGANNGLAVNKNYLLSGVKASEKGYLYINGEKLGEMSGSAMSPDAAHNTDPIYIGGAGSGKSMDGTVCEIIAFDRGLSFDETDSVNAYLAKKWGVYNSNITKGDIKINGESIPAFSVSTLCYKHTLKKGTTAAPTVTAEFEGANATVEQAQSPNGTAYINVEKDGVKTTYSVEFSVLDSDIMNLKNPEIEKVKITSDYWNAILDKFSTTTVNDVFTKFENNGTLRNFEKIGTAGASPEGGTDPWNDGLLYETIRGASDFLRRRSDSALEARIDGYIDKIYAASLKSENGYLSTWAMLQKQGQYFDGTGNAIWYHDAYNFGCMAEAAVHYYKATGKAKLLYVVSRFAEFITENYGYGLKPDGSQKINMVPSHEGPEEMLLELYKLYRDDGEAKAAVENFDARSPLQIDENKYADLVKFWIENRGNYDNRVGGANYGIYAQDHDRFFNQPKGQGHAVRANLFYNGLAAAGAEFKNYTYLSAAEKIWSNITEKQMYVTGGVGATAEGEAYADDYILPNDGYCETCAQVAMGFFSENMSLAFGESKYADTVEKYIYNGVLGCVGDNGTSYYYQQPLDNKNNSRWSWIDHTPCCPPMFLKFYSQLPSAIYAYDDSSVYVNQFISSAASLDNGVEISQTTDLPWGGNTTVTVTKANGNKKVYLRIPDWAKDDGIAIKKDGKDYVYAQENGYAVIDAADGTVISMSIEMNAHRVYSNENVEANRGKVALQYGPVIYCVEKPDNLAIPNFSLNGGNFSVPAESKISAEYDSKLLGGAVKLTAEGECCDDNGELSKITVTAIPFYLRSNRGQDTSYVWINEAVEKPQTISRHWLSQALGSTRSFGNSAAAAFDGNQSTYWSAGSSSVPQAIMVDLGQVTEIDKISAAFKSSFSWDYSLLISDDMDSWTEYSRSDGESIKTFTCVKKAKARYAALKINNAPENELAAVSELSVYSGKTNIAKGKPCSASSTLDTGESVFAMTDGNSDSRYCPSGEAKPQTLLFDLGEIADVTSMEILFEKPSAWTYDISVSADGENFTEYRRETYNMTEDRKVRTIVKNAKARYIKFSITKTTGGVWASVWEFNVKTKTELKDIFSDILGRSIKAAAPENMLISGSDGTLSADVQNAQSLQWQVDKNDLNGFVNIAGANSPRLTQRVTYENAGYKYRLCAVTNGKTVYSNTVSFSVYSKPQSVAVAQSAAGSMQLSARVYPPTARQTVAWSSSDNKTADVSASGLVRFKKDGKVTITARTPDGVAGQITIKNGWVKEGAKFYAYAANTKLLNRLVTSAGRIYCADKTGARVTGGVYTIGKKTYAFDKNGVKISGTKVKKIGKYKYLIKSGVVLKNKARRYGKNIYVAGKSGRALGGNRVVKAGGKLYFVDKSGRAATKRWVSFRKKSYYASANGSLYVNAAVKIGGKKYSFNKKGVCSNK